MTNKLRSVIDSKIKACEGIYGFFPKDDHTNDQELCVKVEIVELLMQEGLEELLDAIIEEMEDDVKCIEELIQDHSATGGHTKEHYQGSMSEINVQIRKLKQVREELSTSLT